jgi:uncharacterized protein
MTFFIPIFPLQIVIFPGEKVNLHIFEPRYKQLIADCVANQKPFGITTVINNKIQELGTTIQQVEIVNSYANGELDITSKGASIFSIIEVIQEVPDKLYMGAIVSAVEQQPNQFAIKRDTVMQELRKLHNRLGLNKQFNKPDNQLTAFDIAHYVGFTLQQEYDFLSMPQESQQWEFILRHIKALNENVATNKQQNTDISIIENVQRNGHFRDLSLKDLLN